MDFDFTISELLFKDELYYLNVYIDNNPIEINIPDLKIVNIDKEIISFEFLENSNYEYELLYNIDTWIKNKIYEISENIFGFTSNKETINELFRSSLTIPKRLSYPLIECRITKDTIIEDKNSKKYSYNELELNNYYNVNIKIKLNSIVLKENIFYVDYEITYIKILEYLCNLDEYLFDNKFY